MYERPKKPTNNYQPKGREKYFTWPQEIKDKIGAAKKAHWDGMSVEEELAFRQKRSEGAKRHWASLTEEERREKTRKQMEGREKAKLRRLEEHGQQDITELPG